MRRAGIFEVGRDRLHQVKNKLQFLLVTEDASANSLAQMLRDFNCPVYKALTMNDIERFFGYRGTKIIGFRRHPLSNEAQAALKPYLVRALQPLPDHPRVALFGASGIGRHHANWWTLEGADVVAFLGSSADSVSRTAGMLHESFGFSGKGYTSAEELLSEMHPDIVDVCLPPPLHYQACLQALKANCHVLCEKPFVYDDTLPPDTLRAHGQEIQRIAERKGLRLGVCTQYVMATREILALWRESHPEETLESFEGNLVSPTRNRPPVPQWTWVDLAPHMLGVAQVLSGCGTLVESTIKRMFNGHLACAEFKCLRQNGTPLSCSIRTFHTDEQPSNVRQITLNGSLYDIGGFRDENGVFQMAITTPDGVVRFPDMLRLLIRSYLAGKIEVPPTMANQNLDWLLKTMDTENSKQ